MQNFRNAVWKWNGKPIKVTKLDNNQIEHILKNVINKNKNGESFGLKNKEWNNILKKVYNENQSKIITQMSMKKWERIENDLNSYFDKIIKKNIKTVYTNGKKSI